MEGTDAEDAELLCDTDTAPDQADDKAADKTGARVVSLHARHLPADPRITLPDMTKYDRLLAQAVIRQSATNQKGHGA